MTQAQAQGALVAALDTDTAGGAALDASDEVPGITANVVIGLIFHDDLMAGFGIALLCKSFGIYREGGEIFRVCGVQVDGGQDDLCFVLVFDARIVQWANAIEREFLEHHLAGNSPPKAWAGDTEAGHEIVVEYQADNDIGGSTWYFIGSIKRGPTGSVRIQRGNKRALRLRLRPISSEATDPVMIESISS